MRLSKQIRDILSSKDTSLQALERLYDLQEQIERALKMQTKEQQQQQQQQQSNLTKDNIVQDIRSINVKNSPLFQDDDDDDEDDETLWQIVLDQSSF